MKRSYPTFRYYYTGGSGDPNSVGDGEVLIGSSDGNHVLTTLQAGPGINIVNGPGSILVDTVVPPEPEVTEISYQNDVTTVSLVDVLLNGMTFIPGEGEFLVYFSGTCQNDDDGGVINVSLYRNYNLLARSTSQTNDNKNRKQMVSTMAYSTFLAGQPVQVRWSVAKGLGTFHHRRLIIQKIR